MSTDSAAGQGPGGRRTAPSGRASSKGKASSFGFVYRRLTRKDRALLVALLVGSSLHASCTAGLVALFAPLLDTMLAPATGGEVARAGQGVAGSSSVPSDLHVVSAGLHAVSSAWSLSDGFAIFVLAALLAALRLVVGYAQSVGFRWLDQCFSFRLRCELHAHLLATQMQALSRYTKGELGFRLSSDFQALQSFVQHGVGAGLRALATIAALAWVAFRMHPQVALVGIVGLPVAAVAMRLNLRALRRVSHAMWEGQAALASSVASLLSLVPLLRLFGGAHAMQAAFVDEADALRRRGHRSAYLQSLSTPLVEVLAAMSLLAAWGFWMMHRSHQAAMGAPALLSLMGALWWMYRPAVSLASSGQSVVRGVASIQHMRALLEMPSEPVDPSSLPRGKASPAFFHDESGTSGSSEAKTHAFAEGAPSEASSTMKRYDSVKVCDSVSERSSDTAARPGTIPDREAAALEVEQLYFSYAPRDGGVACPEPGGGVLRGLHCRIAQGERVALVGASGEGKTTLLLVLMGLLRAQKGRVHWRGMTLDAAPMPPEASRDPLNQSMERWRRNFAWVPQVPQTLRASVATNIRLGRPSDDWAVDSGQQMVSDLRTDAAIEGVARAAHAHEDILALPHGYQTQIGEDGQGLSVGLRQRICLARALLSEAPVLMLDEPTAALDPEAERVFLQSLDDLLADPSKTVLLVTHRLSTLMRMQRVLVMQGGVIVQDGPPTALMRAEGPFRALFWPTWRPIEEALREVSTSAPLAFALVIGGAWLSCLRLALGVLGMATMAWVPLAAVVPSMARATPDVAAATQDAARSEEPARGAAKAPQRPHANLTHASDTPTSHTFAIRFHVPHAGEKPVVQRGFLERHVRRANLLFRETGVRFVVESVVESTDMSSELHTRSARDALSTRWSKGPIHCFVTAFLRDVDDPSVQRRGVHWRDRAQRSRHYIVLAKQASENVLAHELGHFFGNRRHSPHLDNLMSYRRSEKGKLWLAPKQTQRIRRAAKRYLASGELQAQ